MKASEEIKKWANEEDKEILLWLISRYHYQSDFYFVAGCRFEGKYGFEEVKKIWYPRIEGIVLYNNRDELERLSGELK